MPASFSFASFCFLCHGKTNMDYYICQATPIPAYKMP